MKETLKSARVATVQAGDDSRPAVVRPRTYLIGILGVIAVCMVVAFSELVASRGGSIDAILLGATHMPPGAICVLIVLMLANVLVRRLSKPLGLNPQELAVIYFMLVCAALISSFGLVAQLLPNLVGINYFASPQDGVWRETFFHRISSWLVPWDPSGPEQQPVAVQFYEGLRIGDTIPWAKWVVPVIAWLAFSFVLFFLMACVATLLRKQWADNEKLSFPLVQLPMEMINETTSRAFFTSKAMWLGFLIPFLVHGLNGLHRSLPNVPEVPTYMALNSAWVSPPWNGMLLTPLVLSFSVIGFAYLLSLDVSFSMWFFLLFFRLQDYIALSLGYQLDGAPIYGGSRFYQAYQSTGAFAAIAASMLYYCRPHLKQVWQHVVGEPVVRTDRDEFMSYRAAFIGGILAFLLLLVWLRAAGMDPLIAFFMIAAFVFIQMLVLTRFVSEVGLLMLQPAFRPLDLWAVAAPKAAIGAQNLTVLSFLNGIFMRDPRNIMPAMLDSMKGADVVGGSRRTMAIGTLLAVGIGALVAIMLQLKIIYTHGGINLNSWFLTANPQIYFGEARNILSGAAPFDYRAPLWFSAGGAFTLFLYVMRARLWWWPFHPLGYAIGAAWPGLVYWSSFFVGWLVKSVILRYGGGRTYRRFRPFFLGLILGEFVAGILWALLAGLLGLTPPSIPIS